MAAADPKVTSGEDVEYDRPPMWLKVLVIVLGIAIVGMLVAIVTKIMTGLGDEPLPPETAGPTVSTPVVPLATGEISVRRPAGTMLVSTALSGDRLVLTFRGEDGDHILVLDQATGAERWVHIPK
ncbi:hypothetical protein [Pseudokordiimonas caeni]|uniref:hypothetical protein n=1 Tax=Pseudokordiimonas caeni TaxID=2997908 RepID=UPI0028120B1E|nr:hypothetical protein [Pseudokordiimonas caeni]